MMIQGINSMNNSYNQFRIASEQTTPAKAEQKLQDFSLSEEKGKQSEAVEQPAVRQQEDTRSRMADLENISLPFNANETYDYIGKDAPLENLDMMKAISDMQKDKVLEQYQYFVSPQELNDFASPAGDNIVSASEDGIVLRK